MEAAGIGAGAAAAGFDSPQASLEEDPHTSLLLRLAANDEFWAGTAGFGGAGLERLKAELL